MMKPIFPNIVIIGLGLIGGSIALELKKRKLALQVIGVSRSEENRKEALRLKAVDQVYSKVGPFISQADLVVIATPVMKIIPLLHEMKKHLKKDALVTDVGSVKENIVREASQIKNCHLIGGHPIAGTERSGMKSAELNLFKNKKWILTPLASSSKTHLNKISRLIRALGAQVVFMDPSDHDRIFAAVSHLPNLIAYTLSNAVLSLQDPKIPKLSGSSLRDMTRVAASPPEMWRDICLTNQKELLRMIHRFEGELEKFKRAIEKGEERVLLKMFERGRQMLLRSCLQKI
jgi:prephenate dehydrogenase